MSNLSRRQFFVAGAGLAALGCTPDAPDSTPAKPELPPEPAVLGPPVEISASENVNPFAAALYGQLRTTDGNVFLSPSSIHTALAMTAAGAKGNTLKQMDAVLHLPAKPGQMSSGKGVVLSIANALWAQTGYPWSEDYKTRVTKTFHASLHDADFQKQPDAERLRINAWVETQTREKIKDLLQPPHITSATRLVLVNAIYFKSDWMTAFNKDLTTNAPFTKLDGTKVDVPLMHRGDHCSYGEDERVQTLWMPYKGGEISFLAVLPKDPAKFEDLDQSVTAENFTTWWKSATNENVLVWLPKFKIETNYALNKPLIGLGMSDAFDGKANFSGMTSPPAPLVISLVIHKAFLDVDEEGTIAAAATAIVAVEPVSAKIYAPPKIFRADRPFLFALRHEPTGTILFMGRYTNPN